MSYETLLFETRGAIAYVTINRPQKLNALNHKVIHELVDCFDRITRTPEVLGVILTQQSSDQVDLDTYPPPQIVNAAVPNATSLTHGQALFESACAA